MTAADKIKARNARIAAIAATVSFPSRATLMAQADKAAKAALARNARIRALLA